MKKIKVKTKKIKKYADDHRPGGSSIYLMWGICSNKWYLIGQHEIESISEFERNEIYWFNEFAGREGFLIMVGKTFYLYSPEDENEDVEDLEPRLYELIQGGLDYQTALDFLCL